MWAVCVGAHQYSHLSESERHSTMNCSSAWVVQQVNIRLSWLYSKSPISMSKQFKCTLTRKWLNKIHYVLSNMQYEVAINIYVVFICVLMWMGFYDIREWKQVCVSICLSCEYMDMYGGKPGKTHMKNTNSHCFQIASGGKQTGISKLETGNRVWKSGAGLWLSGRAPA